MTQRSETSSTDPEEQTQEIASVILVDPSENIDRSEDLEVADAELVESRGEGGSESEFSPEPITAEIAREVGTEQAAEESEVSIGLATPAESADDPITAELTTTATSTAAASAAVKGFQSWPFRLLAWTGKAIEFSFGLASLVVLLAVVTGIPGAQILTLGYFIEVSSRIAKTGKVRAGVPGWRRAARLGSLALGTFLCLLPIGYLSSLAEAAELIDATSPNSRFLRVIEWVLTMMLVPHMLAAWFCGGRLRYFFWPMLAPFQLGIWFLQWGLATRPIRAALDDTIGKLWPTLVADLCRVTPLTDFFLPAIIIKHLWFGTLWSTMRDGFWDFVSGLRPLHLGWLGLRAFIGSVAWLFVPTILMIGGTTLPDGGAVLTGTTGVVLLAIVCLYLPVLQTNFGVVGKMYALFDLGAARDQIARSPLRHSLSLLLTLTLALPLYFFKIELVDSDLWWALGLLFVAFTLPARWATGWAYARSSRKEKRTWIIWRWPIRMTVLAPTLIFAIFVSVTRFISWGGAQGLFEHHAFLVPAPFTKFW